MHKHCKTFLSKYMLIVCAVCLVGTVLPHNASYAQTTNTVDELKLAGNAEARALFAEAKRHHDGDGVAQDFSKARLLYLKAAGMGHNDARINHGYLYFMGQGVTQDYLKARNWYLSAANNGDKAAQENLALMYEHGLGVDKDPVQVKYWREFGAVKPAVELKVEPTKVTIPAVEIAPEIIAISEPKPIALHVPVISAQPLPVTNSANSNLRGSISAQETKFNTKPAAPVWTSNSLISLMLLLALITGFWFIIQYKKLTEQKKAHVFAKSFYAHHRDQLRVNYLRYPAQNRKYENIDDLWAGALCTLMVRFAQTQQDNQDLVGEQSRKIVKALAQSPLTARQAVFPFVNTIQQKVFADIQAHDFKPALQLTPRLIHRPKQKNPKASAFSRATNIVSLQAVRNKKPLAIPPESLWPDTPGA